MKGTFFQKPFEFNLELPGEQWVQGDELNGSLKLTDHSNGQTEISENFGIALAIGKNKKVKSRDPSAFEVLETLSLNSKNSLDFKFKLPINGPISDKTSSYYIIYGDLESKEGNLQIQVDPSKTFSPLLDVLDIFFRFKLKEKKFNKKSIEFKLLSPESKEFKALDTLILNLTETEDSTIQLTATFNLKNVGVQDGNIAVTKSKTVKKLELAPSQYLFQKDSPNQDAIREAFQGLFNEVLPKQLF